MNCRERGLHKDMNDGHVVHNNTWKKFRLKQNGTHNLDAIPVKMKESLAQFSDNVLLNVNMRREDSVLSFTPDDEHRSQNQAVSMSHPACQISKL